MRLGKVLLGGACAVALLVGVVVVKGVTAPSRQLTVPPAVKIEVDRDGVADRLAGAVRIRTVSFDDRPDASFPALDELRGYLEAAYPNLHATLRKEVVAGHSLLFTWEGRDKALKPILLMAHQDVVPIAPGTEKDWEQPPFDGVRKDGFIWGRGSWDDKGNLIAELEAVETLIKAGFTPERTVYLAFGHDEEILGSGARAIVDLLKSRNVRLDFALDEGMLITEGIVPGVNQPVAMVGTAEKGYLTLTLTTRATPGHSSMPPARGLGAIPRLAKALDRLQENPFPAKIQGVARESLEILAPEMTGVNRIVLANLWLTEPLVRRQFMKEKSTAAMLHTTTAETMLEAGNKDNVLPGVATATVNFRLLPGDSVADVTKRVKEVIADPEVEVKPLAAGTEPSPVSPTSSDAYRLVNRTLRALYPDTLVAPGLMLGATDSRYYAAISDNVFKFTPVHTTEEDLTRFHGTNERLSEDDLVGMVRFYALLVKDGAGAVNAPAR